MLAAGRLCRALTVYFATRDQCRNWDESTMKKFAKLLIVGLVILSMSVDPALACRFFARRWRCCRPCYTVCQPVYCQPAYVAYSPCDGVIEEPQPESIDDRSVSAPEQTGRWAPSTVIITETDEEMPTPQPAEPAEPRPMPLPGPVSDEMEDEFALPEEPEVDMNEEELIGITPRQPAVEQPADDLLVAPPQPQPQEEMTPEAEPAVQEDEHQPAEEPADEIFGAPAEESDEEEQEPIEGFDFFGAPEESESDESGTPEEETEEQPEEEPAEESSDEFDDLFGRLDAVLGEPGGLESPQLRLWVDNTGRFSCHGRMIRVLDGHVRLLKDNGRTTTVPFYRLSQPDLSFVQRQVSAHRAQETTQTVQN